MNLLMSRLSKWVSIPSVSQDGNEEIANFALEEFKRIGVRANLQWIPHSIEGISKRQANVLGILGDPLVDKKIRKGILLTSHLDTAPAGLVSNWEKNQGAPLKLSVQGDEAYGLGIADGKLSFLCMLEALSRFREVKLKQPVCVLGTCGEKVGMIGTKYLLQSLVVNPKAVVVGAPTSLRVGVAHQSRAHLKVSIGFQTLERDAKGFNRRVKLQSLGKIGSSSFQNDGVHSFYQLLDFLQRTSESGFDVQVSKVHSGNLADQVPDFSEVDLYLNAHQFEDFKRFFRERLSQETHANTFRMEMGGSGDLGIRFLPEGLFSLLFELISFQEAIRMELSSLRDDRFDEPLPGVSLNRVIQGNNKLDLSFDVRLPPGAPIKEIEKRLKEGVTTLSSHYPEFMVQASVEYSHPGLQENEFGEAWRTECTDVAKKQHLSGRELRSSWCNEAGQFGSKNYPVVFFGPGALKGNVYSPQEKILIPEIEKTISYYEELIRRVCT